jgi:hypothetical protein
MKFRKIVPVFSLAFVLSAGADTDWPLSPTNADHPIGNTMGEFVQGLQGPYQHEGIDILGDGFNIPSAPVVVVTVGGTVEHALMNPVSKDNYVMIRDASGKHIYRYAHLEYSTISPKVTIHANNMPSGLTEDERLDQAQFWPALQEGDELAKLSNLFTCGFNHLHYEIQRVNEDGSLSLINPLRDIRPRPDATAPEIVGIFLAKHNDPRWNEIPRDPGPNACTVVSGDVDIVVEIADRDDGGSVQMGVNNVGIHRLRWQVCKSTVCNWKETHTFDAMPAGWTFQNNQSTAKHFSTSAPWTSSSSFCHDRSGNRTFMVPTSFSSNGTWSTASGDFDNAEYKVRVEARDIENNKVKREICVKVQN